MISHHHKCIFVHVPKVAGISIEDVFLEDLGLDFRNRMPLLLGENTNLDVGPPRISHLTAEEYTSFKFIPENLFNDYYKFAFVRNPYDRVHSFYKYLGYNNLMSFEKFVVNYLDRLFTDPDIYYFIQPMYNYIYSQDGNCMVNFVGKLENINDDFKTVCEALGFGDIKLKHKNNSHEMSYKSKILRGSRIVKKYPLSIKEIIGSSAAKKEYNQEMKNVIAKLYSKDFEYFNYAV